jgi:hypothetical protein
MLITNPDGHGRRCAVCEDPIGDNGRCARCAERVADPGKWTDAYFLVIADTLKSLRLSDEELALVEPQIIPEIERRLAQLVKAAIIAAALPQLQQRAQRYYVAKGVPYSEAEEQASAFSLKVLKTLFGEELRGNAGAWAATVKNSVFADYGRAKEREERRFGKRKRPEALVNIASLDEESLSLYLEDLPSGEIVRRLIENEKWVELAAHCQQKIDEESNPAQSIEWPEGSLPLRKRRRRRSTES